jgi:large subunit ribosomal protein L23
MKNISDVIIKPLLTEKSSHLTENYNKYSFLVRRESKKTHIKQAIEKFFNVKVEKVSTLVMPGKVKRVGRHTSKQASYKKAIVKIGEGQKIELFKGI